MPAVEPEVDRSGYDDVRRRRRPKVLLVVGVVAVLLVCGPVVFVGGWFLKATAEAGKGAESPSAALLAFMLTFEDDADATGVGRWIVSERRAQLGQQRRDYIAAMAADAQQSGWAATLELGSAPGGDGAHEATIAGDRASVVGWYRPQFTPPPDLAEEMRGIVGVDGPAKPWRAEARRESDGWRLWSVEMPPWCDPGDGTGYSRCTRPAAASPSASPSRDPLGRPREMLPCGPRDPFRQYHSCPPSTSSTPDPGGGATATPSPADGRP